jgi:EpsI family protein
MSSGLLRSLALGMAMLCASGLAVVLKPTRSLADSGGFSLEAVVPRSFGDWKIDPDIVPVVPTPDVQANLDRLYSQIVSRTYVNPAGVRMMLTLAYGGDQSDALKAHRQESCYAAQGFDIKSLGHARLSVNGASIPVTRMLAVRGRRSEPVTYWFTMGDRVVLGRMERLMVQMRFGLSGRIPDGMLVRVSNLSSDPEASYKAHDLFVRELLEHMRGEDVARLVGTSDQGA